MKDTEIKQEILSMVRTWRHPDCARFMRRVYEMAGVELPASLQGAAHLFRELCPDETPQFLDVAYFDPPDGPGHLGIFFDRGRIAHSSQGTNGVAITPLSKLKFFRGFYRCESLS